MSDFTYILWESPIGTIGIVAEGDHLVQVVSAPEDRTVVSRIAEGFPGASADGSDICTEAVRQLGDYFGGCRRSFDLPLRLDHLSSFTVQVLRTLAGIPCGSTLTYGELGELAGYPRSARAVGRAMATNPFPILIPCHRVLGSGGKMTGYSGGTGIATKEWLLRFEAGGLS